MIYREFEYLTEEYERQISIGPEAPKLYNLLERQEIEEKEVRNEDKKVFRRNKEGGWKKTDWDWREEEEEKRKLKIIRTTLQ